MAQSLMHSMAGGLSARLGRLGQAARSVLAEGSQVARELMVEDAAAGAVGASSDTLGALRERVAVLEQQLAQAQAQAAAAQVRADESEQQVLLQSTEYRRLMADLLAECATLRGRCADEHREPAAAAADPAAAGRTAELPTAVHEPLEAAADTALLAEIRRLQERNSELSGALAQLQEQHSTGLAQMSATHEQREAALQQRLARLSQELAECASREQDSSACIAATHSWLSMLLQHVTSGEPAQLPSVPDALSSHQAFRHIGELLTQLRSASYNTGTSPWRAPVRIDAADTTATVAPAGKVATDTSASGAPEDRLYASDALLSQLRLQNDQLQSQCQGLSVGGARTAL